MAENHRFDAARGSYTSEEEQAVRDAAQKLKNSIANKAKSEIKGAVKELGKAVLKKVLAATKGLLIKIAASPVTWAILLVVLPIIFLMAKYQALTDFIGTTKKEITQAIAVILDWKMYDEDKIRAWDENGGDPDYTYRLYSLAKAEQEGSVQYEADATEEDKETITDMLRTDTGILAPEDTLDILNWCKEFNDQMFEINRHSYQYYSWAPEKKDKLGAYNQVIGTLGYKWEGERTVDTTDHDGILDILIAENVKGELDGDERIYSVHWQDVYTLAYFYALEQWEHWGDSADSKYDPKEGGPYVINDVDEYFVTEEDLLSIKALFDYHFGYYYDAIEDKEHQDIGFPYKFDDLMNGNYQIAYRYFHDDDLEKDVYDYEYYDNDDPGTVGGEYPRSTKFVPDSAPNLVYNSIEQYKYTYVSTDEVPGYSDEIYIQSKDGSDRDYKAPPTGIYCVGKWRIVDPRPFINTMADLCPFYRDDVSDKDPNYEYIWSDEMMDLYIFYLETLDLALGTNRASYYEHLKDLYREEKIEVYYYGMKLPDDEMDAFLEELEEKNPGMEIEVDFSSAVDFGEWYEVDETDPKAQAGSGKIPFPSYGVIYNGTANGDMAGYQDRTGNKKENYYTGEIYISQHGKYVVDDWIYLVDGADAPLDDGYNYTDTEILAMLSYMNKVIKGRGDYDFTKAAQDVIAFHHSTGADVAGMLAIIMVENTPNVGKPTWNWFNFTPTASEKSAGYWYQRPSPSKDVANGRYWYNPKVRYQANLSGYNTVEGACMVDLMHKIYYNYWTRSDRKQNTYFRMCFNQYGWDLDGNTYYPQDWDSALVEEAVMESVGHCYCPWWEDAYVKNGYDPAVLWCNKAAGYRAQILGSAGITVETPEKETGVLFVGDSRTICCFSSGSEDTISGEMHDGIKVYAGWGQGYSFMTGAVGGEDFETLAVWLGCNDAAQGKSFSDDYAGFYEGLLAQGKKIILFNVGRTDDRYLEAGDEGYKNSNMVAYNQTMASWASGRNGVTYIDVYSASSSWSLNTGDGIHYSPRPTSTIWNYLKARIN